MIDGQGFRANVGIILANDLGQVLLAKRINHDSWQFPQGGIDQGERPIDAMYRELFEEIGLRPVDVNVLAVTSNWLKYRLPRHLVRHGNPLCIGQKQKWFLLQLLVDDSAITLDASPQNPEFDDWQWVSYWYPLVGIAPFKKAVYQKALFELLPHLKTGKHYVNSPSI